MSTPAARVRPRGASMRRPSSITQTSRDEDQAAHDGEQPLVAEVRKVAAHLAQHGGHRGAATKIIGTSV